MIRPATVQDIPELKKLWERTFDDPLNYVDFMYDRIVRPEDTLVVEEDGKIISMAVSIMCSFSFQEQTQKCVYIYGMATLPRYEWQGDQLQLINRIERNAAAEGAQMSVLVPGTPMLYSYYKKHGYTSEFPIRELNLKPGVLGGVKAENENVLYNRISDSELYEIREQALYGIPHVRWEPDQIGMLALDALSYGEYLASYDGPAGRSYAIYSMRKKHMYVRECLGSSDESVKVLLASLIDRNNPSRVHMRLPVAGGFIPFEGKKKPMGLAKLFKGGRSLSDYAPYMNLMLD